MHSVREMSTHHTGPPSHEHTSHIAHHHMSTHHTGPTSHEHTSHIGTYHQFYINGAIECFLKELHVIRSCGIQPTGFVIMSASLCCVHRPPSPTFPSSLPTSPPSPLPLLLPSLLFLSPFMPFGKCYMYMYPLWGGGTVHTDTMGVTLIQQV